MQRQVRRRRHGGKGRAIGLWLVGGLALVGLALALWPAEEQIGRSVRDGEW